MPKTPNEIATVIRKHAEYEGGTISQIPRRMQVVEVGCKIFVGDERQNDLAEFFHRGQFTVPQSREEALIHAHRFAASERMLAALETIETMPIEEQDNMVAANMRLIARAAIKAARGE